MKKIICALLTIILLTVSYPAVADCVTFIAQPTSVEHECDKHALFAIDESHKLHGIKNKNEVSTHLLFNVFEEDTYINGIQDNGTVIRTIGLAPLVSMNGCWFGLTSIEVKIEIDERFKSFVKTILTERNGDEKMTNANVIAATLYFEDCYVGHIFYTSETRRMWIGRVYFINQECYLDLWAGDVDNDGHFELGFIAGERYVNNTVVVINSNTNTENTTVITNTNTNTNTNTIYTSTTNNDMQPAIATTTGCNSITVTNTGDGNNVTTTNTKVTGDNNVTTTTNNTQNNITLFGITINYNTNTTTTVTNFGAQEITRPTMMRDSLNVNPCG